MTVLMFLIGLIALVLGAELLVRGAGRLATTLGVSPLVLGLTVVAFGTRGIWWMAQSGSTGLCCWYSQTRTYRSV